MPSLVDSPEEITAANLVGNTISSVGMFFGPALGGILSRTADLPPCSRLNGALFIWSSLHPPGASGHPARRTEHSSFWPS
jgi:hypothetical protein